ncbi:MULTISPECIES: YciI family protein [Actinoplanes]|uniref:YciI family protein n=1 Tax=Actinoplanes TaxID=1865 RepID=UPI0005F2FA2B|nr:MULTISPECIES: YciI family protein [Actinoplanes]GLY03742.1 transcription initiation protein [Actinoplanes sp. NBRC 101535]
MAQYAVLIYAAMAGDAEAHDRHAEELIGSGSLRAAFALEPEVTSIRGGVVTDGPFTETKEVVAGFYVLEAPDLDTALRIAATNPAVQQGGGVEVRLVAGGFTRG